MSIHNKYLVGILTLLAISIIPNTFALSSTANEERTAKLIAGAKKEGKMLLYTGLELGHALTFINKFQEKYPFIKVEVYRTGADKLPARIIAEAGAGKLPADVITVSAVEVNHLKKRGIIQKYNSPEMANFPANAKDPDGYWVSLYEQWNILGYNTKLIAPKDVPRNYEDLLNPRWKGKIALDGKEIRWFAALEYVWGKEKWQNFMRRYGQQEIILRNGKTLLAQLLAAGEFAFSTPLYTTGTEGMKNMGAPVETVLLDPMIILQHPIIVSSTAPNPNSAQLFVDFMLSDEGRDLVISVGRIPSKPADIAKVHPGLKGRKIPPKIPISPKMAQDIADNAKELQAQFGSYFGKVKQ